MSNTEKIAIIDLGTNTFHLLLAQVGDVNRFTVLGRYKEQVKMGEGGINARQIAPPAFERGIKALKRFRKLIDSAGVSQVLAKATSAIRSADNGQDFVDVAKAEAGIEIEVINGNTEASYIHEGVKNGVQLPPGEEVLLIDIGGGSVEFAVSRDRQPLLLRSLKIGAARLLEWLEPHDPIKKKELKHLDQYFEEELATLIDELKEFDLRLMVGSSGTFENLATLIAHQRGDHLSANSLNGYRFDPKHFDEVFHQVCTQPRKKRLAMKGIDPVRVDMIVMGGALIAYFLKQLPIVEIIVSENALKEGILFRYLKDRRHRLQRLIGPTGQDLRARAVKELAEKYQYDRAHALKVSELADMMFKQLQPLHQLGPLENELLRYAAVLHDIGRFIHPSGHHKHGLYLIINSQPYGFSTNELVLLANLVRYHRKSLPKREHYHYSIIPPEEQDKVMWLGGILRIADNLDRGHRGLVEDIHATYDQDQLTLEVGAPDDVSMEIEHAHVLREMLGKASGRAVVIQAASKTAAPPSAEDGAA
jgi:exopolyphosphatase/guanosine-5'-triphosphate,3'-diphosphate pyrophosphatase